ncbi:sugar ABC transporter ATP-binding protein [Tanticharoenia sakaeratensis]|uniref:ABC sugar transporter, ATPase subunit n=1 Tax=Tanticharoenia sakaeratensis NBRC 103193 TaxID=1231623 RepID=A0A0D6MLX0_9PROT|nr:sugar ABC transporter ATP-binding protein [Tanticharoenia sakaeratensis]GAN54441.1 ABC sugar transporter, ATPase subunit [Tanticharoenia sakaeratensis NBRC 103193]GBQ24134.1 sugar ABC transporter ATP-binding protein [Tanticharoenia sakaeratensis NBRC 103193]
MVLLEARHIAKSFGHVAALRDVSLEVAAGEIVGLLGENGAGKSTLIKILTGLERHDAGDILLDGRSVAFSSPRQAQDAGIAAVYQEINLIPERSVADNLFINRAPRVAGLFINRRQMISDARALLSRYGLDVDPARTLRTLGLGTQQLVSIIRTVSLGARVVILDEPTSALSAHEVELLFGIVRTLREERVGVIYVSHRLSECYALCDRMTVLRDGVVALTEATARLPRARLIAAMLGRELVERSRSAQVVANDGAAAGSSDNVLHVEHLNWRRQVVDVGLDVRKGEVVGLAGLLGSGRTETMKAIYGAVTPDSGTVTIMQHRRHRATPARSLQDGLAFLSEDRRSEGIFSHLTVAENLSASMLRRIARWGIISRQRRDALVSEYVSRLGVKTGGSDAPISSLSGGNQQKVLIGRALSTDPSVVMLDDPTRGIDVGAKAEIHRTIADLASHGMGVLVTSSELEELVDTTDRLVVLDEGRVVDTLATAGHHADDVLAVIAGMQTAPSSAPAAEAGAP